MPAVHIPDQQTVATAAPPAGRRVTLAVTALLLVSLAFCVYRIAPIFTSAPAPERASKLSQIDWQNAMRGLDAKQTDAAARYIRASTGSTALHPQRSILQGRLYLDAGKLFAAKQAFEEAVGYARLAPVTYYWLGATYYALSDPVAAENFWLKSLELDPSDVNTHRSLSMTYYDRGAIDHAVHHLRQVAALAPADARPHRLLGLIHKDYERYGEAAEFYRAALARSLADTTRQEVHTELAECLTKTREYEEALHVIREAQMTPAILVLKAECLIGLGRSDEAAQLLDEVLGSSPDSVGALVARSGIHLEQQQAPLAVELLERAVELEPADYLANFRLSQALRSAGDSARSATVAARADDLKRMREEFSQLHQDAADRPRDADIRYQLGELAMELDMPELAVTWLRVALELDPQHVKAQELLQRLAPPTPDS